MTSLTDRQHRILTFERQWWKHVDARTTTVRELFSCSPVQYRRELDEILDLPEALAYDPLLVKRLRRRREERATAARTG
jgi:hypothetical protein